jgi:tetratricopeptide (TPR) repeat protein
MRKSYLIAIIVSVALGLIVLFLLLPTQPKSDIDKANNPVADSVKIQQAIELVNGPQPMQGIQMLLTMVEENPNNVEAHFVLGEASIRSRQMEKAVEWFSKVIELQPQNKMAYLYRGKALMQLGSFESAIASFDGVIAIDSNNSLAYFYKGIALKEKGDIESSIESLNIGLAKDSTSEYSILALFESGKMNEQLGNWDKAKSLYKQILRHNENPVVKDSVNAFIKKIDIKLNNK